MQKVDAISPNWKNLESALQIGDLNTEDQHLTYPNVFLGVLKQFPYFL